MKTLFFSNIALSTNDLSNEVTKSDEVETSGKITPEISQRRKMLKRRR